MSYNTPKNYVKISSQTASSSASISFTSGINSNFINYLVRIRSLVPATNQEFINLTFSTNSGSSYISSGYLTSNNVCYNTTVSQSGGSPTSAAICITDYLSNSSSSCCNSDIILYNLNSSVYSPTCLACSNAPYYTLAYSEISYFSGYNSTTTAVNAIKFAMSSGNIASGTFTLYGIENGGLYT